MWVACEGGFRVPISWLSTDFEVAAGGRSVRRPPVSVRERLGRSGGMLEICNPGGVNWGFGWGGPRVSLPPSLLYGATGRSITGYGLPSLRLALAG